MLPLLAQYASVLPGRQGSGFPEVFRAEVLSLGKSEKVLKTVE